MTDLFEKSIDRIKKEFAKGLYNRQDHNLSWNFLLTHQRTLSAESDFLFVGLNPGGGGKDYKPVPQVKEGNAYRVEKWSGDGATLQRQVQTFFQLICDEWFGSSLSAEEMMDSTLTANLCPFRSPTWNQLPNQKAAVTFSNTLWPPILEKVEPKVPLCLGKKCFREFRNMFKRMDYQVVKSCKYPTGWGRTKYILSLLEKGEHRSIVAYIPHLSRYKLMSNEDRKQAARRFLRAISDEIDGIDQREGPH